MLFTKNDIIVFVTWIQNRKLPIQLNKMYRNQTSSNMNTHPTVLYSNETERQKAAARNQAANRKRRMLSQDEVPKFLESRLQALYKRSRIEGALTQDGITAYLAKFAKASGQVISERSPNVQRKLVEEFKETTNNILTDISGSVTLSEAKTTTYRNKIKEKAEGLNTVDISKRFEIVQDIGVTLTEAAINSEKKLTTKDLIPPKKKMLSEAEVTAILKQKIVPIGLSSNATKVTVGEYFRFPLNASTPDEENWFAVHRKYLDELSKQNLISSPEYQLILSVIPFVPIVKYRKYFDIFPEGKYQDSILMAVFSLFQNKAFIKLQAES